MKEKQTSNQGALIYNQQIEEKNKKINELIMLKENFEKDVNERLEMQSKIILKLQEENESKDAKLKESYKTHYFKEKVI